MRVSGGGTDSFTGFEYFGSITLASECSEYIRCGSSGVPAVLAHFWLSQCRMLLRPHLYCLPSRFTYREVPGLVFLGLCGIWSFVFPGTCAPIPLTVPAPVLVVALRSVAEVAAFSQIRGFYR